MAAPCDLREAVLKQDAKLEAESEPCINTDLNGDSEISKTGLISDGSRTVVISAESSVTESDLTDSLENETPHSAARPTLQDLILEATNLQSRLEATIDSNIQVTNTALSGSSVENILETSSEKKRSESPPTSTIAAGNSLENVLMAAMNPKSPCKAMETIVTDQTNTGSAQSSCITNEQGSENVLMAAMKPSGHDGITGTVIGKIIQTATGTEFHATNEGVIPESATEESRVFLASVLQAAAEKEMRAAAAGASQEGRRGEVLTSEEGDDSVGEKRVKKENYRVVTEVGIQANDYDIERRSGKVPARQRIIPAKFRDYKNLIDSDEENGDDSDFEPAAETAAPKKRKTGKRGRPRKDSSPVYSDTKEDSIEALGKIIKTSTGYKCPRCGKVFSQKGNLKVHMWTHTSARPFPCDIEGCDKAYRSNESLRRHKLVHMGIKPYECEECKRTFASNVALKEHTTIHNDTKPYTCEVCSRSFRQVSCFRRHLITHTTATPFACQLCDRRFSQMVYLRSHMKMHTGERPFKCDKCTKAFAHQSDLARHKIIHTGTKPYECPICSAKFSDPSSRRRHCREHMNTKPFECTLCGEKFKRQNQIRAHMNRWHNGTFQQQDESVGPDQIQHVQQIHLEDPASIDVPDSTVVNIMIPETSDATSLGNIDVEALANQRKIVSLIQNLNTGYVVQEVEIASPANQNTGEKDQSETGNQNVKTVPQEKHQLEIPINDLQTVESEDGNVEKTLIAIAEVQDDEKGETSSALPVECAYQIIQELADGGEENQVYEIQYQTSDNQMETSLVQVDSRQTETMKEEDMAAATLSATTTDGVDYVKDPDFASQEYFNWLSNFTELCKILKMPLTHALFEKISQVHKSITDFMAKPSGVLNDKENFRVLMSISKDLNNIISNHLAYVMESMDNS